MAKRFTDTEKWNDPWFLQITSSAKVLFCYLCDKCDMAGFYERNDKMASFYTGIPIEEIPLILEELKKSVVIRDRWVFVKNFLRHQKNLPLNPENNAHKAALKSLEAKKPLFSDVYEELELPLVRGLKAPALGLLSPIGKGKGKGKGSVVVSKSLSLEGGMGETKATPPHVTFVENFKKTYEGMIKQPFKAGKEHYVISANLIKNYGLDSVIQKAQILGRLCENRSAWFTREGWGGYTLETLSKHWNSIVEDSLKESSEKKDEDFLKEVRRQEELRARASEYIK